MLNSVAAVQNKIAAGKSLLLAGEESLLRQLPRGRWIAGTIPYFMDESGGVHSDSQIFVNEIPACASAVDIREYTTATLPSICLDAPENGFSVLIIPAGSPSHIAYAQDFPRYKEAFLKPVIGWISGVNVAEIGKRQPKVFAGVSGKDSSQNAVVMHVVLPREKHAEIDIVNVFQPGSGDTITVTASGFTARECRVNGKSANLARYMTDSQIDFRLPLTANYNGSIVNVSVQSVDEKAGVVNFYAPVFAGMEYKFAKPVADYVAAFNSALPADGLEAAFSCNCILNYLYAGLEGKRTGNLTGPITFGEIAHQLLNQTLVRLLIRGGR
jgi:hypothetical protein